MDKKVAAVFPAVFFKNQRKYSCALLHIITQTPIDDIKKDLIH